ncbi:excinuclease ABC subunit UvrC [Mycoplasmopsis columbina]|uniref:excinuclease ABC subunit UvrC n=1 Tax=Mycoplasmopsis columbina TaxID=114881 RepID=UPI0004A75F1C|nr:excinuclease ABC subunit UvrC [Mycoplasmopsis columbina]VEU76842.1 excinuclease ABC subunit C [Mycoplasmopsis columbina]
MTREEILEKLSTVTSQPGIYLWKNSNGNVIYVGKAKNLKKRMHQYFEGAENSYKTSKLVQEIADFDVFVVHNNKEALLLERHYIHKYNPEYNILLLDDKKYPYIKIELKNNQLDISLSRKVKVKDTNNLIHFGPFPNGYGATTILKLLQREAFFEKGLKIVNQDSSFWEEKFKKIKEILSFNKKYLKNLEQQMFDAAEKFQFEIAKDLRDSLNYLTKLNESQVVELKDFENIDVLAFKTVDNVIYLAMLFYRYGILINKDIQTISIAIDTKHTMEAFLNKYYQDNLIPKKIVVSEELTNYELNDEEISNRLIYPKSGIYKQIIDLAFLNLDDFYKSKHLEVKNKIDNAEKMLHSLSKYVPNIDLKNIVVFDNSNLNNSNPVGVAVVYTNGIKNKNFYRKYNHEINLTRQADVEYMKQTVTKYLKDLDKNITPSLIIADGGLPQVNEIRKILTFQNYNFPVIGLVKDERHRTRALIDLNLNEVEIAEKDLFAFLSEIQIEVDRFAKEHLRTRQKISSLEGKLQSIKGLGVVMENKLLAHFKTYSNIYNASLEELEKIIPKNIALKIYNKEYLK